jgi:WD40 repeat protein
MLDTVETFPTLSPLPLSLRMHPKKPIVATSSDDATWKLWSLPTGELIMSGDGHKDWVSGIDFHPR